MGLEPIAEENLRKFLGPPPADMYKKLYGLNDEEKLEAVGYHREYGRSKAIILCVERHLHGICGL